MEAEAFEGRVDLAVSRLVRAYRSLLSLAEARDVAEPHLRTQALTAATEVVYNCQTLLDRIHELRLRCILEAREGVAGEMRP